MGLVAMMLPTMVTAQTATTLSDADLPRTFTFEVGSGDSAYVSFANGADGWCFGGATYSGGARSMYISNDNGATNNYSTANVYSYAWITVELQQSGEYEIAFDWKGTGESSYDYMYVYWAPDNVTPTANSTLSGATQIGGRFNQQSSWQHYYTTRVVTDADLGTYKLIFMWRSDGSVFNSPAVAVDNLYFGRLTCPAPTALTFSNLTNNGATATWTPVGEETSWMVMVNGEEVGDSPVSSTSYTFSGLDANTDQSVTIRAVCGVGDTSMSLTGTFRTLCENGNCQIVVAPSSSYSYSSYYNPSVAVYQNGSALSTGTDTRTVDICNGDSVIVLVAQMPSSTYYTPSVRVTDIAGTDLFNATIAGRSAGDTLVAVGNGCPSCIPVSGLTLNTFDASSATISWTPGNDETLWAVYVNGEEALGSPTTTNSFVVSGLESNTHYTLSVRAVCGYDDTSAARSVSVHTECDGYAELPFSSGFEDLQTGDMPDCWLQVQTGTNTGLNPHPVFPSAYRHTPNAHNSDVYFEFESNQGETEILALPRMQNIPDLQLSFYASITNANFRLEAGVIETNEQGMDVFVPVDTVNLIAGSSFSSAYRIYNVLFNSYDGDGERIAIRTTPTGTGTYTLMIDDFSVIYVGVPVLSPFNPATYTYTIGVDTAFTFSGNLMTGSDVSYQWTSTLAATGGVTLTGDNTDTVTVSYSAAGIDTLSLIASTAFGADTESLVIYVVDPNPVSEFPYENGFEEGEDVSWNMANNASGWYIGQAVAATGGRSLYVSSTHGATNEYTSQASANSHAYRQIRFTEAGEYELSFQWKCNGGSDAYLRAHLVAGAYRPNAGNSPSGTNLTGSLHDSLNWTTYSTVIDVDTGLYTLDFYWYNASMSTYENPGAAVDNIRIAKLTCTSVGDLAAQHVYAHDADIVWTPRGDETSWWVVVDGGEGYEVTTDSIHLDGLTSESSHTVAISAICGSGDTSMASTVGFTTTVACVPVGDIVFSDITGSSATASWTPGGTETAWKIVVDGGDTVVVAGTPSYSLTGLSPMTEHTIQVIADCGSDDGEAVGESATFFTLCDDGTCNITLVMADSYGDGWNGNSLNVYQNGLQLASGTIATGNSDTLMVPVCSTMPVAVVVNTSGSYPYEMSAVILGGSGVELYSFATNSMSASNNGDTLVNTLAPCSGCMQPSGLEVTASSTSSISIAWNAIDSVMGFLVSVDGGAWTLVSDTTYTASGLTASSSHTFAVRTLCEMSDTSDARTIGGATECDDVVVFPWSVGFETEAELLCWQQEGQSQWRQGTGDYSTSTGSHGGSGNALITHSSSGNSTKLISPTLNLASQSSVVLTFWHVQRSWSGDIDELKVYYRAQQSDDWTLLESYTGAIATWTADTIALPNLTATYQIAFEMVDHYGYGVAIDDITVGAPGATPVATYTVTATSANSAMGTAAVSPSGLLPEGTSVTATATPTEGYLFVNWTADGTAVSSDNPYTFTVTDNVALIANFEAQPEPECEVPTEVTVTGIGLSTATIGWSAAEGQNSWDIHVTAAGFDQTFTASSNPYTVSGLASDLEYTVAVRANCSASNQSEWSATATFSTSSCQPVSGVTASNITAGSALISWTAPNGVDDFELEYGASGFGVGHGTTARANGSSTTLTGLTAGILYDVYVRSICAEGVYSIWSNATSFETPDDGTEGIDDIANAAIALYPNPATTTVTLTGIDGGTKVTVVDMNGRAMGEYTAKGKTLTIDLAGYAQGAYFVRITGEQVSAIRKLMVK